MIHELDITTALQVRKRDNNKNVDIIISFLTVFFIYPFIDKLNHNVYAPSSLPWNYPFKMVWKALFWKAFAFYANSH